MKDARVLAIAEVLGGLRSVLGLPPNTRADLLTAFAAEDERLEELREALGELLQNAQQRR